MNEEQAVLNFFAQQENLPLGLAVAEQMDQIREQLNNRFWQELMQRLAKLFDSNHTSWQVILTEDRNAEKSLSGLHCSLSKEQSIYLHPMIEQQFLGGTWRIYFGLMWSSTPSLEQLALPAVNDLKSSLQSAGFNSNENFLGWQWTTFYPRRKDFLMRFSQQPEKLLADVEDTLRTLLIGHRELIEQANEVLDTPHQTLFAALNQVRDELIG